MSSIGANLQAVRLRIESALRAAGRPANSVRLVAVSKTFVSAAVREAAAAGLSDFGENYVTEGVDKIRELLFGNQMQDYDRRFSTLAESFQQKLRDVEAESTRSQGSPRPT